MLRLNLGSGAHKIDGFLSVDAVEHASVDLVASICHLSMISTDSVDAIYSAHALQCLPDRCLVPMALNEWFRVLKSGGTCNIEVPNSRPLIREYLAGTVRTETFIQGMYGVNEDGLRQTICFDFPYLCDILEQAGFVGIHVGPQACYSRHDARTNLSVYCCKP